MKKTKTLPGKEPLISVGIVTADEVQVALNGQYRIQDKEYYFAETVIISSKNGGLLLSAKNLEIKENAIEIQPLESSIICIENVVIGKQFHWEKKEIQSFEGRFRFLKEDSMVTAINEIELEKYIASVISSEMSSANHPELLKAHAVMSRSWLMAQILNSSSNREKRIESPDKIIRWYDREDHDLFDVCADDHCQRYQGIGKIKNMAAIEAVKSTRGIFLTTENQICDARFSKCCGGISEAYDNIWDSKEVTYLHAVRDHQTENIPDLTLETDIENWILASPDSFCNTENAVILDQILPDFDRKTQDFYRWKISYTNGELSKIIHKKSGIDFGRIEDLISLKRGKSGRIIELQITGEKTQMIVGKELEIRKWLSPTHLYSSAFVVNKKGDKEYPETFELTGAGWGHGAGLCQIGAAVMALKGYDHTEILAHYFRNATIKSLYE